MQKGISNWFRHVQAAPAVLIMELEMTYPDGCSYIWAGLTASISPGSCAAVPVASQCHVTLGAPTGTAASGGVALLRPQTYVLNPSLVASDTTPGLIPSRA